MAGIWLVGVSAVWGQCTVVPVHVLCYGEATGSATVIPSGGIAPYTYLWDDPSAQTTATATSLVAGTYNVNVSDNYGFSCSQPVTINQPAAVLGITVDNQIDILCHGVSTGVINITVSGGTPNYEYSWTGPDGFTSIGEDISNLAAGTYNLTVSDANLCTATLQVTLIQPGPPTSLAPGVHNTQSLVVCINYDPAVLSLAPLPSGGNPPYSYQWYRNASPVGADSPIYDPDNLTAIGPYEYYCLVSDTCGQSVETVRKVIIVEADPTVSITGSGAVCQGDEVTLTTSITGGTGTYTYIVDPYKVAILLITNDIS